MPYIGVLQTGDVDEAIALAEKYIKQGRHIMTNRIGGLLTPESEIQFMEQDPEGYVRAMNEHDPVEYEVHVEYRDWKDCDRTHGNCPVHDFQLEANQYPGLCDRCQYYMPKEDK
jgi:hypothetical protein